MDDVTTIVEQLGRQNTQLAKHNETLGRILAALEKRPSKILQVLTGAAAAVSIGSVVNVIRQILDWVGGK